MYFCSDLLFCNPACNCPASISSSGIIDADGLIISGDATVYGGLGAGIYRPPIEPFLEASGLLN